MINSIKDQGYNWENLKENVKSIVDKCIHCLHYNSRPENYHELSTITSDQPFKHIAIDLAGLFPTSNNDNNYLFICLDIHLHFMILRAIKNKNMNTIGEILIDIFILFRFPQIIQSDNGTEFVNQIIKEIMKSNQIDHRLISPYHPQANGAAK
jgi:Integrase core domain